MRAATNLLYEDEIEALYKSLDEDIDSNAMNLDLSAEEAFAKSLTDGIAATITNGSKLTPETDIFTIGVDSMQVLNIVRNIKAGLGARGVDAKFLSPRMVYNGSSPNGIAQTVWAVIRKGELCNLKEDVGDKDDQRRLEAILEDFKKDLPCVTSRVAEPDTLTFLLTGSTGALGPYILANLLDDAKTAHVFALGRDPAAAKRQLTAHQERDLNTDFSRVTFQTCDLSKPDLGLPADLFTKMKRTVTHILHNAWPVNFNLPLASFIPHVAGVRHLIDFSASAVYHPHITFVSTVGTATHAVIPVKEGPLPLTNASLGYGHSKAISCHLLDAAREQGIRSAVVRAGQIAGPRSEKGIWNKQEWFPRIVASAVGMGILPDSLGAFDEIDWLPVDAVAGVILDVSRAQGGGYFHSINPTTVPFPALQPAFEKYFGNRVKIVSLREWIVELEAQSAKANTQEDVDRVPGIKLLDFYQSILIDPGKAYETSRILEVSKTLREVGPIRIEWMSNWLKQWNY